MAKADKHKSALEEKQGVSQSEIANDALISKVQEKRKSHPITEELISGILEGNISSLSRAITLVESTNTKHLKKAGNSFSSLNHLSWER